MTGWQAGYTTDAGAYPAYLNLTENEDGTFTLTVRADPTTHDGVFICGFPGERGKPGRCTPGDSLCNNYCNMAPQNGPMADSPMRCSHVEAGDTVQVRLTRDQLAIVKMLFP